MDICICSYRYNRHNQFAPCQYLLSKLLASDFKLLYLSYNKLINAKLLYSYSYVIIANEGLKFRIVFGVHGH